MLISQDAEITCRPVNKQYLEGKGYEWKYNKIIKIKVKDLQEGSKADVQVLCDYCLENNKQTIITKSYTRYLRDNKKGIVHKDCCTECIPLKQRESLLLTYGTDNCNKINVGKEKDIHIYDDLFQLKCVKPLVDFYVLESDILPFECLFHNEIVYKSIQRLKVINIICNKCMAEFRRELYKKNEIEVFEDFIKNDLIPLSNEKYINIKTPIKCTCLFHPNDIQKISYYNLKYQYGGCRQCIIENRNGSGNPNWKGGTTSENHKIRASNEYKQWREEVFKRDVYTCQCCGDKIGGNLEAHHLENFSSNEDLRFDIDNGITLCDLCHNVNKYGSFHHQYGAKNNNAEQVYEYIKRFQNGEFNELRKLNKLL